MRGWLQHTGAIAFWHLILLKVYEAAFAQPGLVQLPHLKTAMSLPLGLCVGAVQPRCLGVILRATWRQIL